MADATTHFAGRLHPGSVSSVQRAVDGGPEAALAPNRAQADLLVGGLVNGLAALTVILAEVYGSWLPTGLGLLAVAGFWLLHRIAPGGAVTRRSGGVLLMALVALVAWQGRESDDPALLFYVAAAALILYKDALCLWPGALFFCLFHVLTETLPATGLGWESALHVSIMIAHTAMCSACAVLLRRRSLRAAEITADLEHARRELAAELDRRRRIESELVQAKERAEALAHTKADFLATMSHELRTPMNGILGMSRLMAETDLDGEQREMLDAVLVSSDALLDIIGDVLDYSKMEAGRLAIDPVPCDLRRVCEAVLDVIAPKAEEKSVALYLRFAHDVPRRVVADAARIRQVLLNLASNAVKFTADGSVELDISRAEDGRIRFAVIDTGIGLTPVQIERLFQPFVQAEVGTTRTYGGTGLGLAISKRLVDLMQGAIGVDSSPGRGSTFWFHLPLPTDQKDHSEILSLGLSGHRALVIDAHEGRRGTLLGLLRQKGVEALGAAEAPASFAGFGTVLIDEQIPHALGLLERCQREAPAMRRILIAGIASARAAQAPGVSLLRKPVHADALFELLSPGGTRRIQPRPPLAEPPPAEIRQRGTVLLADDHYVSLHQTESLLRQEGFAVVTAVDGVQVLRRAGERRFDLLLIDAQLPDLDASQVVTALRTGDGPNRQTPVVAVGGTTAGAVDLRLLGAGIEEVLERPLAPPALRAAVDRWTKR